MTRQRTFTHLVRSAVPAVDAYRAFVDETSRASWLPDGKLRERTATEPKSARFDWDDGTTRVNATFVAKSDAKTTIAVDHSRLANTTEAELMRTYWRARLTTLRSQLENHGGG